MLTAPADHLALLAEELTPECINDSTCRDGGKSAGNHCLTTHAKGNGTSNAPKANDKAEDLTNHVASER
jgi:hypothetical protein